MMSDFCATSSLYTHTGNCEWIMYSKEEKKTTFFSVPC